VLSHCDRRGPPDGPSWQLSCILGLNIPLLWLPSSRGCRRGSGWPPRFNGFTNWQRCLASRRLWTFILQMRVCRRECIVVLWAFSGREIAVTIGAHSKRSVVVVRWAHRPSVNAHAFLGICFDQRNGGSCPRPVALSHVAQGFQAIRSGRSTGFAAVYRGRMLASSGRSAIGSVSGRAVELGEFCFYYAFYAQIQRPISNQIGPDWCSIHGRSAQKPVTVLNIRFEIGCQIAACGFDTQNPRPKNGHCR